MVVKQCVKSNNRRVAKMHLEQKLVTVIAFLISRLNMSCKICDCIER